LNSFTETALAKDILKIIRLGCENEK